MTDDNIKINVPYHLITSVKLNPEMIDLIKSKNGGPKKNNNRNKRNKKSHVRPALNLGDEMHDILIYNATSNPPRIFGSEDPRVFETGKNKKSYYDKEPKYSNPS